jgi:hypothetical protein
MDHGRHQQSPAFQLLSLKYCIELLLSRTGYEQFIGEAYQHDSKPRKLIACGAS